LTALKPSRARNATGPRRLVVAKTDAQKSAKLAQLFPFKVQQAQLSQGTFAT